VVFTLAFLVLGLTLLHPVSSQPGQWKAIDPVFFSAPASGLNNVWMISSTQGWAVGDSPGGVLPGLAVYWDGIQWRQILTPPQAAAYNLESVACLSANNCLAVGTGTGPVLLQWDGISWMDRSLLIPAGTTKLHAIYMRSDGLGFAVGEGSPNILRVNLAVSPPSPPTVASEATKGAPDHLMSVMVLPPGTPGSIQGFAVGDNGAAAGAAWRWDGTPGGWLVSPPGAVATLRGIQILNPNEAIAVGDTDGRTRWNGASWTPEGGVVIATANWRSVFAVASNDEWIVGSAVGAVASIAHWNGVAWTAYAPPNVPVAVNLNSVKMLSSSDGWAVGQGGAIIRWDGLSWKSIASPVASTNYLRGVWLASSADGWAVGDAVAPALSQIFRWDGANWNLYQTSPVATQLNAIHGTDTTNVLAVGNFPGAGSPPAILRWTGGPAWTDISPAGVAIGLNLYGVFAVNPSLAFAVGQSGTMLRWDGTVWASILSGTAKDLRGIWMVSDTDGWAVGDVGTIVRWNGAAWAPETSPTLNLLNSVQALSSTDVWAVGNSGTILHRNGLGWTLVPSGVTQNLNSLYMLSDTEGWAVGASDGTAPVILFWNGSTWTRVFPIPVVNLHLLDIWMVASQDGWSVGQAGLILRFGPGAATTTTTVPVTATSTTTQSVTATSTVVTSTVSTQVTSTLTVPTTATSTTLVVTTGTVAPSPVPGFPLESILAGLVAGAAALFVLHRRRPT
jgi:photosystem II stability/assembly factor-like uncharacterized protein